MTTVRAKAGGRRGSRFAGMVRADIDGELRGAIFAAGGVVRIGEMFELDLAALVGTQQGAYAGGSLVLGRGAFKPKLIVGVPVFFVEGVQPGLRVAAGLRWEAAPRVAVFAEVGVAFFPTVPAPYEPIAFVPSLGLQIGL